MTGIKRDCACPRVRHRHGTRGAYMSDKCRCDDCRAASSRYAYRLCQRAHLQRSGLVAPSWTDSCGTVRRLEALAALGWTTPEIGARLGVTGEAVDMLRRSAECQGRVLTDTARRVTAAYDALSMRRPEPWTRYNTRTRNRALGRGWLPPLAWDDDTIDDPAAQPCTVGGGLVLYVERNRMHIRKAPLDEVEVERFVSGHHAPLSGYAKSPEVIEAVRRLAARGLSDAQIGDRVGISGAAVLKIRERHGIPAGVEPNYRVRWRTATGTERVA